MEKRIRNLKEKQFISISMYLLQMSSLFCLLPSTILAFTRGKRLFKFVMPVVVGMSLIHHHKPISNKTTYKLDSTISHSVIFLHLIMAMRKYKFLLTPTTFYTWGSLIYSTYIYHIKHLCKKSDWWHASLHASLGLASFLILTSF